MPNPGNIITGSQNVSKIEFTRQPTGTGTVRVGTQRRKTVVPVIRVKDIQGPMTREIIEILHLIDLRIRALNLIFPIKPQESKLEEEAESRGVVEQRKSILQAIFIPTETLNPLYYLRSLESMSMTFLNPAGTSLQPIQLNTSLAPPGTIGEEPNTPSGGILQFFISALTLRKKFRKYRIAHGKPHRLVAPSIGQITSTNLVVLKITKDFEDAVDSTTLKIIKTVAPITRWARGARKVLNYFFGTDEEVPINRPFELTFNGNKRLFNLFSASGIVTGKDKLRKQIEDNFAGDTEKRLLEQLDEVTKELDGLSQAVTEVSLLPVVISDFPGGSDVATDFILKFASLGMPISLLDLGLHYGRFSGTVPKEDIAVTQEAKQETIVIPSIQKKHHMQGNAFDLTLVPYYVRTGMILKKHSPFILQAAFPALTHPEQPIFRTFPDIRIKSSITLGQGTSIYLASRINIDRHPSRDQENASDEATKKVVEDSKSFMKQLIAEMFLKWANLTLTTEEILSFDDLTDDDQHWYHVFVESK